MSELETPNDNSVRAMKVLFFFLYGGRTGSEVALHNLICNADRQRIKMAAGFGWNGELMTDLPQDVASFDYSKTMLAEQATNNHGVRGRYNQALTSIFHRVYQLRHGRSPVLCDETTADKITKVHKTFAPDAWYVNTLVQPDLIRLARSNNIPVILHSHELEEVLQRITPADVDDIVSYPKLVIASSQSAANVLGALGRTKDIEVCYETIDLKKIESTREASRNIRNELGFADDAFVWAMSGTLDPNKSPGLFVEVAHEMLKRDPRVHFMWIGGSENGYSMFVKDRARVLKVDSKIAWVAARTDDYYDYLNAADGFVLTSQRDCFPIVMLEVAALGKPIVSFDSGGVREFLQAGMGVVVRKSRNSVDLVNAMEQIMRGQLQVDPLISQRQAANFDVSVHVKQWENVLHRYLLAQ